MPRELRSLEPMPGRLRGARRRLGLRGELVLALLPTATVLVVLALVDVLSTQRLLFASLSSSAFLIYLDPEHRTNSMRTLLLAQVGGAALGWLTYMVLGAGYLSGGAAMVATIVYMIALDAVHPPAIATAMSFALRAGNAGNLALFGLAVVITALLVILERAAMWLLARHPDPGDPGGRGDDQQQGPSGTA